MRWTNADADVDNALAKLGYQIYKDMMSDGVVKSCMQVKIYGVTVGGHAVLPAVGEAEAGYEKAQEIAKFVEWNLSEMKGSVETLLADIAGPAMKNGFSVQEKVWKVLEKEPYKGRLWLEIPRYRSKSGNPYPFDVEAWDEEVCE
jgi:hypothetical protein